MKGAEEDIEVIDSITNERFVLASGIVDSGEEHHRSNSGKRMDGAEDFERASEFEVHKRIVSRKDRSVLVLESLS